MQNQAKRGKSKAAGIAAIVVLLLLVGAVKGFKACRAAHPAASNTSASASQTSGTADAQHEIDPDARLIFTKHARCRMNCRHITEDNIREVLREGHVNYDKSEQKPGRCPTFAIEDAMADGTQLRIVFAKCAREVRVVTCIDRTHEYECHCEAGE
ncbi:MAG: DUF4258 domain-containing protein [Chitinophagales bacterium]